MFTQSFGDSALGASVLTLPITGFLPGDDPRVLATVDAVAERLTGDDGLVRRYDPTTGVDGLTGAEGDSCCARSGWPWPRRSRAASHANDLGLLAERSTRAGVDPAR